MLNMSMVAQQPLIAIATVIATLITVLVITVKIMSVSCKVSEQTPKNGAVCMYIYTIVAHGMDDVDPIDRTPSNEMPYLTILRWPLEQQK